MMPRPSTWVSIRPPLRIKYRVERDKRLRADGNAQYADMSGRFSDFLDDPYVETAD